MKRRKKQRIQYDQRQVCILYTKDFGPNVNCTDTYTHNFIGAIYLNRFFYFILFQKHFFSYLLTLCFLSIFIVQNSLTLIEFLLVFFACCFCFCYFNYIKQKIILFFLSFELSRFQFVGGFMNKTARTYD